MAGSALASASDVLASALSGQLAPALLQAVESKLAVRPLAAVSVLSLLAGSARKAGSWLAVWSEPERTTVHGLGYRALERAPLAEVLSIFILVRACQGLDGDAQLALLTRAYRTSSNEERVALLRALPLLPEPARFLAIATDSCRTHVQTVFEAIACDNPYPARYFDDAAFNQLVVKALFVGAPLARVEGLAARTTPELKRMVRDYVSERRAAGRSVPSDVTLVEPEIQP